MATGSVEQQKLVPGNQDWQRGKNLGGCMKELYDRNLWTDVAFRCKDHEGDERIRAHKVILASRSHVFQLMFFGAFAETRQEYELPEDEQNTFDLFLRYLYTDSVSLIDDVTATALLQIAHRYEVPSLVKICADYLATDLTTGNACELLSLALCYQITTLSEACGNFIDQNATAILNTSDYLSLSSEFLLFILQRDTFYAAEELIFRKANDWASERAKEQGLEHSGSSVRNILGESFFHLRLPTLTYKELVECRNNTGILSAEEFMEIADFINHIPDATVSSNSCVSRLPLTEILHFNTDDVEEKHNDSLSSSLEIQVSRNVQIVNFTLSGFVPSLYFCIGHSKRKRNWDSFENVDYNSRYSLNTFVEDFMKPCKIVQFQSYSKDCRFSQRKIYEYEYINRMDLPSDALHLVADGWLTVGDLSRSFKVNVSKKETNHTITLSQPLVLQKRDQPYRCTIKVGICINYQSDRIELKTNTNKSRETAASKSGHVKISTMPGSFCKSITLQTIAYTSSET